GQSVAVFPGRSALGGPLTFTPDGGSLILSSGINLVLWHLDPPPIPPDPVGHVDEAWSVAFSPDGRWLATGSDDTNETRTLKIWDLANGREVRGWQAHPATVGSLAFSPDGRLLASASLGLEDNLRLWDPDTGQLLADLKGHTKKVRSIAISPDGALLLSRSDDGTVRVWDIKRRACLRVLKANGLSARGAVFLQGGRGVASTDSNQSLYIWNVESGKRSQTIQLKNEPLVLVASPDEAILAVGDNAGHVDLFDTQSGALLRTIQGPDEELGAVVFYHDGSVIAVAGANRTIRFWDVVTGQGLLTLAGHTAQINDLAFSPDGLTLASSDHSGAVRLWRADAPRPVSNSSVSFLTWLTSKLWGRGARARLEPLRADSRRLTLDPGPNGRHPQGRDAKTLSPDS
ncbi:MAG: WD40 repeat domain-containing protein, partial [Isosphaeraceae bacterium]